MQEISGHQLLSLYLIIHIHRGTQVAHILQLRLEHLHRSTRTGRIIDLGRLANGTEETVYPFGSIATGKGVSG